MALCEFMGDKIQRIIVVRHGYSIGNHDGDNYKLHGDSILSLHQEGWKQAIAMGRFLESYYRDNPPLYEGGPTIRISPFQRVKETFSGLLTGANGYFDDCPMAVDPLLSEQDFGLYSHIHKLEDRRAKTPLYAEFTETTRKQSKFYSRLPMGESPFDVYVRLSNFYQSLHRDLADKGMNDFLIVAHGRTNQMLAMRLLKLPPELLPDLKTPGNCDVWKMERNPENGHKFGLERIYDGEEMCPVSVDLKAQLDTKFKPLSRATLPKPPKGFS